MRLAATRLFVLFGLLACAMPAWPQASTGLVNGTVRDPSGAVVPHASVSLTNAGTNVTSKTATNEVGFYLFPGVVPGEYRIAVEADGMQKFEGVLTVRVQQSAAVDVNLKVGQTTTEVTVQDVTPLLVTDRPSLGQVLERQRIEQLPINGRNLQHLLNTVPGIEAGQERAYGLRQGSHVLVLDGSQHNEVWEGWDQQRPPGLDSIQEFRVEVNNASAKFTRPTTVIMSSRSGTNELHGSLFYTARNNAIGVARRRQETWSKAPQLIRNEFGASGGGPVFIPNVYDGRNRTFFFFAYEAMRYTAPTTLGFRVPTEAMRNGDFRGLVDSQGRLSRIYDPQTTNPETWQRQQFAYGGQANVIDPARISPLAKALYAITPLPTNPQINPMLDINWWGSSPNWIRSYTTSTRIDHRFSDKDQFYARYTQGYLSQLYQYGGQIMLNEVPGAIRRDAPTKSLATSWVRTISPTLFNELMVSGTRDVQWRGNGDGKTRYPDQMGLPNPFLAPAWPNITGTGLTGYVFNSEGGMFNIPYTYMIVQDNATKVKGRHEIQFGFQFRYDQLNTSAGVQYTGGNHNFSTLGTALYDSATARTNPQAAALTGHDAANMYLGLMNYGAWFGRPYYYFRSREYAPYVQDNIRVNRRLTLNLGMRWEMRPPIRDKNNIMAGFDKDKSALVLANDLDTMYRLGAALPSVVNRLQAQGAKMISYEEAGLPQSLIHTNWKNFGPRLGFAYRLSDGERPMVLRGGYRISYFPIPLASWASSAAMSAPLHARFMTNINSAARAPDGIANYGMRSTWTTIAGSNSREALDLNDMSLLPRGFAQSTFLDPHQPDGQVQDWNLTFEKEIMRSTVARVAYVGNHAANLEQQIRLNDSTPAFIWYAARREPLPGGEFSQVATRPYDQQVYGDLEEYRKTGWSNWNGVQFEIERRYDRGFGYQVFYVMGNALAAGGLGWNSRVPSANTFLPGALPSDFDEMNRLLNYRRDISIPKHRVRWNWIADLPFGRGKLLGRDASGWVDKIVGGWQVAGMGYLGSTYMTLPQTVYPNGEKIEIYGYKYPIQDCRAGACQPGYLWWNGYIPANQINSYDANGKPTGVMGVPEGYKPAGEPFLPWPKQPDRSDPNYAFYGTNTVWVPLKNGTVQRIVYNDNLHPWRNQFLPSVRQWGVDASLFKRVAINERFAVRFNADFFNVFNRPNNPNSVGGDGILATRTSGSAARQVQLSLRLVW